MNLFPPLLLPNFVNTFRLELEVYIPNCKCQVNCHSSPSFAAACAAAIARINPFFIRHDSNQRSKHIVLGFLGG